MLDTFVVAQIRAQLAVTDVGPRMSHLGQHDGPVCHEACTVEPPLVIHDDSGAYTPEEDAILSGGV